MINRIILFGLALPVQVLAQADAAERGVGAPLAIPVTWPKIWPVAREGDGNCCPSSQVSFRVQSRGDALDLVSMGSIRPYRAPH
jgi:hypothetical protein